jgi:hypothetical protein
MPLLFPAWLRKSVVACWEDRHSGFHVFGLYTEPGEEGIKLPHSPTSVPPSAVD